MFGPGFTIDNPFAQTRIVVLPSAAMDAGTGWLLEVRRPPGSGPDNSEHFHRTWTETFEVVAGTAHYRLGGAQGTLRAGERVVMPPHVPHIHPWNAADGELVYHQAASFAPANPRVMPEVMGGLATIAELAAERGLSSHGQPKHPLQLAVTLKMALKHGRYDARLPVWAQRLLAASAGSLAEALGYRAIRPRYRI